MDWIKKVFNKIKVLNSNFNSKPGNVNQNVNNDKKNWEYKGVYHAPYSKDVYDKNEKLIKFAKSCKFITNDETKSFMKVSEVLKKQAKHAVYVEKLQDEDIYKFICKTTEKKHLNKCNMEIKTITTEGRVKPYYVGCEESIIQLNKEQFEKNYKKIKECDYIKSLFNPLSRIEEFENAVKKAKAEGNILYQNDLTAAMWMEDTLYSYISLKIYEEEGSYETARNVELDNFMENPEIYTKNYLKKEIESKNKNEENEEVKIGVKLPEE